MERDNNILLTEELFLQCGGKWYDGLQQGNSLVMQLPSRISIVFYDGNFSCCSIYQDGKLIDLASGMVRYLHELQNLAYRLTKYEIKINDSAKH